MTEGELYACQPWFLPEHFAGVVEELAAEGQCGHPVCQKKLNATQGGSGASGVKVGQKRVDMKAKKVVDITQVHAMFCSDVCEGAARSFLAQLSTEGVCFRPIARAYLAQKRAQAAGQELVTLSPSNVYDLVTKRHEARGNPVGENGKDREANKAMACEEKNEEGPGPPDVPVPPPGQPRGPPGPGTGHGGYDSKEMELGGKEGRGPLKMKVLERELPVAPRPLNVWTTRGDIVEGHAVSDTLSGTQKERRRVEEGRPRDGEGQEGEEKEEESVPMGHGDGEDADEAFGTPVGHLRSLVQEAPAIVAGDFFLQLWSTLSSWVSPASHQYVALLASNGGDENAALRTVHGNPTDPLQIQRALLDVQQRERALGGMLAHHVTGAMEIMGLTKALAPSTGTHRLRGFLSTFDLYRPLPSFLSSAHYTAMALLFVEVLFRGELTELEGEEDEQEQRERLKEGVLQKLKLSTAEYASLKRDLEISP